MFVLSPQQGGKHLDLSRTRHSEAENRKRKPSFCRRRWHSGTGQCLVMRWLDSLSLPGDINELLLTDR
ncbi:rCG21542 [Rattus norvegicus]|uniref:RCG21542 n=1 Tax=Rattus norvegicus TaxID=10116 RepID=A6J0U0_RAT|nr:rCG21542 [Rattus norvegicus]